MPQCGCVLSLWMFGARRKRSRFRCSHCLQNDFVPLGNPKNTMRNRYLFFGVCESICFCRKQPVGPLSRPTGRKHFSRLSFLFLSVLSQRYVCQEGTGKVVMPAVIDD